MRSTLLEFAFPARLMLVPERKLSDDEYWDFCAAHPDLRFERTAQGEIVIVPPAGGESSYRNFEVAAQLRNWARTDRRGKGFDSSGEFILPNGAALSPDAAWVSNERLARLSKEQRRKFLPLCPEFVIEVKAPSDRLRMAKAKMEEWIANRVQLGWLIDGDKETVHVYRAGRAPEKKTGIAQPAGEGPVEGFILELADIWAGL